MKQKHIDAAREVRLWIRDIVVPVVGIMAVSPDVRETIVDKYQEIKQNVKTKFKNK